MRPAHAAGFGFERVVAAVAVGIEPFTDRVSGKPGLLGLRPVAPVGIDAARRKLGPLEQDMGDVRREQGLEWRYTRHHPRHSLSQAGIAWVETVAARVP